MGVVGYTDCTLQSQCHHKLSLSYIPTHNMHGYVMNIKDSFPSLFRTPLLVNVVSSDYTLLKMRCDVCVNHRLLQRCDRAHEIAVLQLGNHARPFFLRCKNPYARLFWRASPFPSIVQHLMRKKVWYNCYSVLCRI